MSEKCKHGSEGDCVACSLSKDIEKMKSVNQGVCVACKGNSDVWKRCALCGVGIHGACAFFDKLCRTTNTASSILMSRITVCKGCAEDFHFSSDENVVSFFSAKYDKKVEIDEHFGSLYSDYLNGFSMSEEICYRCNKVVSPALLEKCFTCEKKVCFECRQVALSHPFSVICHTCFQALPGWIVDDLEAWHESVSVFGQKMVGSILGNPWSYGLVLKNSTGKRHYSTHFGDKDLVTFLKDHYDRDEDWIIERIFTSFGDEIVVNHKLPFWRKVSDGSEVRVVSTNESAD